MKESTAPSVRGMKTDEINEYASAFRRYDSWANVFTGLGMEGRDKRLSTKYTTPTILDEQQLIDLYRGDGLGRRIVTVPADEMTREGFKVNGDPEGVIVEYLEDQGFHIEVNRLIRWAKLFGGAIGVILVDDSSSDLALPLNEGTVRSLQGMKVFSRFRCPINPTSLYKDPMNPKFLTPEYYEVTPIQGSPFRVHESRVVRLDSVDVPDRALLANQGWGDSDLQGAYERLRAMGTAYAATELIIEDFAQAVMRIKDLGTLIASDEGYQALLRRLNLIDMSRHIANTAILDVDEEYSKHSTSVTGLPDLLDRFVRGLAASCNPSIPVTLLMGQAPAGLNATGDSDVRNWYDSIRRLQYSWLLPVWKRLVHLAYISKDGPYSGTEEDSWKIEFNRLWQLTEKEEADVRKTIAETDKIYIDTGVVDPEEVAVSRFAGSEFNMDIELAEGSDTLEGRLGREGQESPEDVEERVRMQVEAEYAAKEQVQPGAK